MFQGHFRISVASEHEHIVEYIGIKELEPGWSSSTT